MIAPQHAVRFDPLKDLLVAQSAPPANVMPVNLRALTPFQRALLVIDGTVTKFLEAYTMEPVAVVRISQESRSLPIEDHWLEAAAGEAVLVRQVLLKGESSGTIYAYAVSVLVPARLPDELMSGLEDLDSSLGRALLTHRLESRREVLWFGRERLQDVPDPVKEWAGVDFVSRTYRIISGGLPIMLISERFPAGREGLPSHH